MKPSAGKGEWIPTHIQTIKKTIRRRPSRNLRDHLGADIKTVIQTVEQFLELELPSGTVRNLQATRKELNRAWSIPSETLSVVAVATAGTSLL